MTSIEVPGLAAPGGHYAHATTAGGLIFISGQLPIHPIDGRLNQADFAVQAGCAIDNLLSVLKAAGSGPERLLKVNVYLVGIEHWAQFNELYAERLGPHRPARAVIPVPELHHGFLVEIDGIAAA